VRIFSSDPVVVEIGRSVLYWAALFQAFDAVQFISDGALRGAGDTKYPMLIVLGAAWFLFLPLAYLFGTVLDRGVLGAWTGATLYIVVIGVAMFARLKTGRWRRVSI
jgi:MATE family multidrug resistance protein